MHTMHPTLRRLDLNLLLVFDALFRNRSVVAAADELAMSSSACSHALSRLRTALGDELFVRYDNAMQPTAHAEQLAGGISQALGLLSERLACSGPFVPAESTQTFTLAAIDFTAFALLPPLIARLEKRAPHIHVKMLYETKFDSFEDLTAGRVQFVLGFGDKLGGSGEGIETMDCLKDDYVVAARHGHPRISDSLTLEQYLSERHVAATPWSDVGSVIDHALAQQNLTRDVAVQLPSIMTAPFIVAGTDYLMTLPRKTAQHFTKAVPLSIFPPPFPIPHYVLKVYFHARHAGQASHRWMREQMLHALKPSSIE
ncbi:LysR family transcriptional regulator [Pseudomonas plecoglossicida]|nr:LysR family transcriptional regulator [Pseudomonas plecoglossicida]